MILQELDDLERMFNGGDRTALFMAIRLCAMFDRPLPQWAANAFLAGYRKILRAEARSWDDAFGPPFPKGVQLPAIGRKMKYEWLVFHHVRRRHKSGQPLDDGMFEAVGRQIGVGARQAKEMYYGLKDRLPDFWKKTVQD